MTQLEFDSRGNGTTPSRRCTASANGVPTRDLGAVYTPTFLAQWVARCALSAWTEGNKSSRSRLPKLILDPACGEGELLEAIATQSQVFSPSPSHRVRPKLHGLDLDATAIQRSSKRFGTESFVGVVTNSVAPPRVKNVERACSYVRARLHAPRGFDLVIANPPWGALAGVSPRVMRDMGYQLAVDQFDISDLFVELSVRLLTPDGVGAFIIPDSFFFPVRRHLRTFLAEQTEIKSVVRLGEKIFPSVNRGCAVVIVQKKRASIGHKIITADLPAKYKRDVLRASMQIESAIAESTGAVSQSDLLKDAVNHGLAVGRLEDQALVRLIASRSVPLSEHVLIRRGVELSKKGLVTKCRQCGWSRPTPTSSTYSCKNCGKLNKSGPEHSKSIVSPVARKGYAPIVSGEAISRYSLKQNSWIDKNIRGINYKSPKFFEGPKVLLRKTGIGINAVADESNALCNQVVYILRLQSECPLTHRALLGIINSRLMNYCLAQLTGETSWRSHPYVTQAHLEKLPLPAGLTLRGWQARQLANLDMLVGKMMASTGSKRRTLDLKIERLVLGLYGLTKADYNTIYSWLTSVEQLQVIRELSSLSPSELFD